MPMAALVKAVDDLDFAEVDVPALFYYSPKIKWWWLKKLRNLPKNGADRIRP